MVTTPVSNPVPSTVQLPPLSMFGQTPAYQLDDGTVVFGLRIPTIVPDNTDRALITNMANANRLDLIAAQYEQNDNAWWCLCDASNVLDPLCGTSPGTQLRIPLTNRLPN